MLLTVSGGATDNKLGAVAGAISSSALRDMTPAINKDNLNCFWSPHHFHHARAVEFAAKSSIQYIENIMAEGPLEDKERELHSESALRWPLLLTLQAAWLQSLLQHETKPSPSPVDGLLPRMNQSTISLPPSMTHLLDSCQSIRLRGIRCKRKYAVCHGRW
jgi:hypothetical protein